MFYIQMIFFFFTSRWPLRKMNTYKLSDIFATPSSVVESIVQSAKKILEDHLKWDSTSRSTSFCGHNNGSWE